jgi:hypothetical protein
LSGTTALSTSLPAKAADRVERFPDRHDQELDTLRHVPTQDRGIVKTR